jgi:hypothetical protein
MKLTSYIGFFRMLLSSFLLCLFGSGTAFATPTASKFVLPERDLSAESVSPVLIPRSYLITLKKEDQISSFTPARDINSHTAFHRRAADLDFSVRHEFKNASLYYGLSIEVRQDLTESQILERLSEIPEVASVVPMQLIQPPKPVQGLPLPKINASGSAQFRAQASVLPKYNIPDDINSPLKMVGISRVYFSENYATRVACYL